MEVVGVGENKEVELLLLRVELVAGEKSSDESDWPASDTTSGNFLGTFLGLAIAVFEERDDAVAEETVFAFFNELMSTASPGNGSP